MSKFGCRALSRSFQGKVTRFSVDVTNATRTMHTEVDVPNTGNSLVPGLYAEAVLSLNDKASVTAVPLQAVNHEQNQSRVLVVNSENRIENRPITVRTADRKLCGGDERAFGRESKLWLAIGAD